MTDWIKLAALSLLISTVLTAIVASTGFAIWWSLMRQLHHSDRDDDQRDEDQRLHSVASGLDDAATTGGDGGIDEGLPDRLEPGQRAFLGAHETAITGDTKGDILLFETSARWAT